jgi:hypothetical protein
MQELGPSCEYLHHWYKKMSFRVLKKFKVNNFMDKLLIKIPKIPFNARLRRHQIALLSSRFVLKIFNLTYAS